MRATTEKTDASGGPFKEELIVLVVIIALVAGAFCLGWYISGRFSDFEMERREAIEEKKELLMAIERDNLQLSRRFADQVSMCLAKCQEEGSLFAEDYLDFVKRKNKSGFCIAGLGHNDPDGAYCFCNVAVRPLRMPKVRFVHQGEGVPSDEIGESP